MMTSVRVAVAYHSGYGKTASLAEAVVRGASSAEGARVDLIDVTTMDEEDWTTLDAADAIVFGSPTYFGSVSARMKLFLEATGDRWADGPRWKDKLAAGFTNSKTMSGDKLNTLVDLAVFATQHGMIWVGLDLYPGWHTNDPTQSNLRTLSRGPEFITAADGDGASDLNRLGSWLGAMSQGNSDQGPDEAPPGSDLRTGEHLGRRVALLAQIWVRGNTAEAVVA
jgi:multimeric flavodoxin WrbA